MQTPTLEPASASVQRTAEQRAEAVDPTWRPLYQVGGIAALVGVGFAVLQMTIEAVGVNTVGQPPNSVAGWFTLLENHKLLGLTELTAFQIPAFALLIPVYLAVYAALRRASPSYSALGTAVGTVGIAVYLSSNTALSMLSLADRYAAAATDAERSQLLAAGEAMLAVYTGSGVDVGLALMCIGALLLSAVMLRSEIFNRPTAVVGILAGVTELAYYISLAVPATGILLLIVSGVILVLWMLMVGIRLLQLGRAIAAQVV